MYDPMDPYGIKRLQAQQLQMQQPAPVRAKRVHGEAGADALTLPPDSEVLALDENEPILWIIKTDSAGYKSKASFNLTPIVPAPTVDAKSLEARLEAMENRLKALEGKSNEQSGA